MVDWFTLDVFFFSFLFIYIYVTLQHICDRSGTCLGRAKRRRPRFFGSLPSTLLLLAVVAVLVIMVLLVLMALALTLAAGAILVVVGLMLLLPAKPKEGAAQTKKENGRTRGRCSACWASRGACRSRACSSRCVCGVLAASVFCTFDTSDFLMYNKIAIWIYIQVRELRQC